MLPNELKTIERCRELAEIFISDNSGPNKTTTHAEDWPWVPFKLQDTEVREVSPRAKKIEIFTKNRCE